MSAVLPARQDQVLRIGVDDRPLACGKASLPGAVSQRACVFCGSRVVLYPIADALHLVHGPIGCAAYTWDIRGALSSGPQLHRLSFSTDLQEKDIIFGGEGKLRACLTELIVAYHPQAAFVYSTCIVGIIGDDVPAVCKAVSAEQGIPVIPVESEGFKGTKKDGYTAACKALFQLMADPAQEAANPLSINILGDFNLAGEVWHIRRYYERMGVRVVATITGDGRVADIRRAPGAALNVVQCSGSMTALAQMMRESFGVPFIRVSYIGIADTAESLYAVAKRLEDSTVMARAEELVREEVANLYPQLLFYRKHLQGKRAAIYVGGAFKAISLVKALRLLGMTVVLAGSQTGNADDYRWLEEVCDEGTVIIDDANPLELSTFMRELGVDLLIGGVKERPIAYKLGVAFCDHNHERKLPLEGFIGMANFAREVYLSVQSPVWRFRGETR